jgi:hypothetical protein
MLKLADTNLMEKEPVNPAIKLRSFRNKFLKHYIQVYGELKKEDLSALLLYFALAFIENNRNLADLFLVEAKNTKRLADLTDDEMSTLGDAFLAKLMKFLPSNLSQSMVIPNKVSWQRVKIFYKIADSTLFFDIANLAFIHQIFCSTDRKEKVLPTLQKANKKISKDDLIAFTQLYTPKWVVDFLIVNVLHSFCEIDKISSRYRHFLMPHIRQEKSFAAVNLDTITLIDPACGAGQFLFSAFDFFLDLYQRRGFDSTEAATSILSKNIFAADIDDKALWVAGLGLLSKYMIVSKAHSQPDVMTHLSWITVADAQFQIKESDFLGSIDNRLFDEHFLKRKYSAVVTNPPYVGRRCLSREIRNTLKIQYPNSSSDLSAAFLERCLAMLSCHGKLGMITQSSVMAIPSYANLRNYLLKNYQIQSAINCGPGVFPLSSGEKIDSILLVINNGRPDPQLEDNRISFIDISDKKDKHLSLKNILRNENLDKDEIDLGADIVRLSPKEFSCGLPNNVISQLLPDLADKTKLMTKLGEIADIRQGLATTDNNRFVRYVFDVDNKLIGDTWMPYVKGAGGERYFSDNLFVVKWKYNGKEIKEAVTAAYPYLNGKTAWVVKNEEFYFKPGLCFSFINKAGLAVRRLPAGSIFDVASSAIFCSKDLCDKRLLYYLQDYKGNKAQLQEQLNKIRIEIDNKVLFAMVNNGLLDNSAKDYLTKILNQAIANEKKWKDRFTDKQLAHKLLGEIIAKSVYSANNERLVLVPIGDRKNLLKVLNLTRKGSFWLENKLGISIENILSRSKIIDLGKLIQEPSRYFSFYIKEYNTCMFFSAASVRSYNQPDSTKNIYIADSLLGNTYLLARVNLIWRDVLKIIGDNIDWTSKDLIRAFDSLSN